MTPLYEDVGLVRIEVDPVQRRYVTHWTKYHGPQFRKALGAMMDHIKAHGGVTAYISDASHAKDVPSQDDFQWVETVIKPELLKAGLKKFITVTPASSIARMSTTRFGKLASQAGVETWAVSSLAEALDVAEGRKAA